MWILVIIIVVIVGVFISKRQGKQQTEMYDNIQQTKDFGQECRDVAEKILHDAHSGCAIGGCCVYDCTVIEDDADGDDEDEMVCYCEHYGEYVKRRSPCEYFKDRKANNG